MRRLPIKQQKAIQIATAIESLGSDNKAAADSLQQAINGMAKAIEKRRGGGSEQNISIESSKRYSWKYLER